MFPASVPILTANAPQVTTAQDTTGPMQEIQLFSSHPTPANSQLSSTWPPASKTSFNLLTFLVKNCQCLPTTYRIESVTFSLCGLAPSLLSSLVPPKALSSLGQVTTRFFQIHHTCTSVPLLMLFLLHDVPFPFPQPSELLLILQLPVYRENLTFLPH